MAGPFMGVYENMKFPPYQYREYPKWIGEGKNARIVHSKSEELEYIATDPEAAKNDPVLASKQALEDRLVAEQLARRKVELELEELRKLVASKPTDVISTIVSAAAPSVTEAVAKAKAEFDPSTPIEIKKR